MNTKIFHACDIAHMKIGHFFRIFDTGVQMAKSTKYFFMFCLQSLSFQMSWSLGWQEHECSQRRKIVNLSRDEKQCKEK